MKKFLLFIVVLFHFTPCKAHVSQGFESFFHDTHQENGNVLLPVTQNRCFIYINDLFNHQVSPYTSLPNDSYMWYTSSSVFPVQPNYWDQTIPGALQALTLQQQATLAINRFCIGITNNNNVPAFQNLLGLLRAYRGLNVLNLQRALTAGGYNTSSARFLYKLLSPRGIPQQVSNLKGQTNQSVSVVLKLQRRPSKDLKEIHWSSLSFTTINLALWHGILNRPGINRQAIRMPIYISIKRRIDRLFTIFNLPPPHSATFIVYDETSMN